MPSLADLKLAQPSNRSTADSTLLLLLGLNLLLLAFFIMLNSLSTHGARHAQEVLAKLRETSIIQGANRGNTDKPMAIWKNGTTARVQGVVLNRLHLSTLPLDADANRIEVLIPMELLFTGNALADPDLIRQMASAAGSESEVRWMLEGPMPQTVDAQAILAARLAVLAKAAGHVQIQDAPKTTARVVIIPGQVTNPDVGQNLQTLGQDAGGMVQGVHHD